jgi:hypothetical protein
MKANVGTLDKALRVVAGVALLAGAILIDHPLRWAGLIGIVPLATGLLGYCPVYALFGFDTCPLTKT